jgi:hypothetical protein
VQLHVNEALVRRQLRGSLVYLVLALIFLLGGFFASLSPDNPVLQYGVPMPSLVIGLLLWWRNQALIARWGPRNRQEAVLARGLRGLDDRHHLFGFAHPSLPDYLIVGPMGVLVVVPRQVSGAVSCYDDRWRHEDRRSAVARALLWFAPRATLGNPTADAQRGIQATYKYLAGRLPATVQSELRVDTVVVFTAPKVELGLHGCPVPVLQLKSFRGYVRRMPKSLSPSELAAVVGTLAAA